MRSQILPDSRLRIALLCDLYDRAKGRTVVSVMLSSLDSASVVPHVDLLPLARELQLRKWIRIHRELTEDIEVTIDYPGVTAAEDVIAEKLP